MIGTLVRRQNGGVLWFWQSTIGKKVVMAITGFILFGYLVLHLWGNLKLWAGPVYINTWGVFLREFGGPVFSHEWVLWIVRVILLAALVLHVLAAYQLSRLDLEARPVGYARRRYQSASFASRTMRWGGVIILLFVIYHILHFTTGTVHPRFHEGDVYNNIVYGFQVWYVALFYVLAMLAVGLHLYHGVWSMFQTLGWNNTRTKRYFRNFATGASVVLTALNVALPLSVLFGFVRPAA